jgi:hypothetical protein
MQKTRRLLIPFFCFFLFITAGAQDNGRLSGRVVDRATQLPLAGVSVSLPDSFTGTTTDSAGIFRFTDLANKTFTIVFTGVGYQPQTITTSLSEPVMKPT